MVAREERWREGIVRKFGMDMYTLLYLKWMTKKGVPYSTGSLGWKEALPTVLLCTRIAPKEQVGLSPYEMLYGRPFVCVNDLFLNPEA